jgi:hypothetical protein
VITLTLDAVLLIGVSDRVAVTTTSGRTVSESDGWDGLDGLTEDAGVSEVKKVTEDVTTIRRTEILLRIDDMCFHSSKNERSGLIAHLD